MVPGQGDVLRDAGTQGHAVGSGSDTRGCAREPIGQRLTPVGCYHSQKPAQLEYVQYAQAPNDEGCFSPRAHVERPEEEQIAHVSAESSVNSLSARVAIQHIWRTGTSGQCL